MRTINQYVSRKKNKKTFSEQWRVLMDGIILPTIQRINATTIGNDLVSVQPMNAPIGNLRYLDFQYSETETTFPFWKIKIIFKFED